jgi:dolichol-phosphate mannosyltransferase
MKKLSIIIPVYNEEKTVAKLLRKLISIKIPVGNVEYIVVDDGSTDNSKFKIQNLKVKGLKLFEHTRNLGKGAAVRTGLKHATGDYIIIQDADLEYNPSDIIRLIKKLDSQEKLVVYGTRLNRLPNLKRDERTPVFFMHYFGNKFLSLVTSVLYQQWLTDMESCYKLIPKKALKDMKLHAKGFEFEPEITAKLLKRGYKIAEVSITTKPRGYKEGKKLHTIRDGTKALLALLKYRFVE